MTEEKESSVLFNLRELMTLEEDRVREEEEERLQREAAQLLPDGAFRYEPDAAGIMLVSRIV